MALDLKAAGAKPAAAKIPAGGVEAEADVARVEAEADVVANPAPIRVLADITGSVMLNGCTVKVSSTVPGLFGREERRALEAMGIKLRPAG